MPRGAETASELAEGFHREDRAALARAITWCESGDPRGVELLELLHGKGGGFRTGLTGPPGAGKSTLADALARCLRAQDRSVSVLAVDPSSPFSGGALLGDRIRMEEALADPELFVRSMASRGAVGGLAPAAGEAADLLDAFGFDEILIETVGAGQDEVDIAAAADTAVVVLPPNAGDGIQAMKSGLMEIADLFVVGKCDLDGSERLVSELNTMLDLRPPGRPRPPIVAVSALSGKGVSELAGTIAEVRERDALSGRLAERRADRLLARTHRLVEIGLRSALWEGDDSIDAALRAGLADGAPPSRLAAECLEQLLNRLGSPPDEVTRD